MSIWQDCARSWSNVAALLTVASESTAELCARFCILHMLSGSVDVDVFSGVKALAPICIRTLQRRETER